MKNCLRDLRKARSLSQAELADAVEVTRQTINAVEADKYDPSLPLAYKLAAFFGLPVERLFFNPFREGGKGGDGEALPPARSDAMPGGSEL